MKISRCEVVFIFFILTYSWNHLAAKDKASCELVRGPEIEKVLHAAVEYNRLDPKSLESLKLRAQLAFLLPQKVGITMDKDYTTNILFKDMSEDPNADRFSSDNGLGFRIVGEWDLRSLVYNSDTLTIQKQQQYLAETRILILMKIVDIFYERATTLLDYEVVPSENSAEKEDLGNKIGKLTAQLDIYTGGWYRQALLKNCSVVKNR